MHDFNLTYYSSIILGSFSILLFPKLCWHIGLTPSTELHRIIQICIPKTIVKSKRKHPYITAKVLKLKYQKDKLWKKYSFSGDSLDYLRYTQKRNEIRNLTRSLRLNYESNIASSLRNNLKRFWTYVKSKTKIESSIPTLKSSDNEATTDNDKAAMLNSFFSSVFTNEDLDNLPHINSHQYSVPLSNILYLSPLNKFIVN